MNKVLSRESASEQVARLLDYYDCDRNDASEVFKSVLLALENAFMLGRLEIEIGEKGCVLKQHLGKPVEGMPNPLVYGDLTAKAKLEIDKYEGNYGRTFALLGVLSGEGKAVIEKLRLKDLSIAETLGAFFLLV